MPEQFDDLVSDAGIHREIAHGPAGAEPPIFAAEDTFALGGAGLQEARDAPGRRVTWRQLGWGFWVAATICLIWILLAIFAGFLPLANPNFIQDDPIAANYCTQSLGHMYSSHPLGCDPAGRDLLSRAIFGARVSLIVGFASIGISQIVGGILGIIAGYFRGWIDEVLTVITNVFLSFPYLVLALVIVSFLGRSMLDITLIIAILAWPLLFRVVRASTIEYSQREYVLAAQALGSKRSRILLTLLVPDIIPSAITYGLLGVSLAIIAEGSLSFLSQSVKGVPTWGNMIAIGSDRILTDPVSLVIPCIAMFTFILPINYVGDRLRAVLDVRQGVI